MALVFQLKTSFSIKTVTQNNYCILNMEMDQQKMIVWENTIQQLVYLVHDLQYNYR